MSERIEKLLDQCRTKYYTSSDGCVDYYDYRVDYEKFAELIVEECMNMTRGAVTGLEAFNNIKEHFGVE